MKIYTKKGDTGQSRLLFGRQISKSDPKVEAYGTLDTAISAMGLARALCGDQQVKNILLQTQRELFTLGSELASDPEMHDHLEKKFGTVRDEMVEQLERWIDEIDDEIDLPRAFLVPGASPGSGALDLARSLLRASERRIVGEQEQGHVANPEVLRYVNRLSDLLFMLARLEDKALPFELTTGEAE